MTFESTLVEHCAPTLAGIKAASLFRYCPQDRNQFAAQFRRCRMWFTTKGLELRVVKGCRKTGACLIYLYRRGALEALLAQPEIQSYLSSLNYAVCETSDTMLRQLSRRLCLEQNFPHEIGVFLDYPLEDVKGFVEHKGEHYTCVGPWKAYGDPEKAKHRFASYRQCTQCLKGRYAGGTPITQLIVAA